MGNLVYRGSVRGHNPVIATAARVTIAEVDDIVEVGELDPEEDWFAIELTTGVDDGQWFVEDLQDYGREIAAEMARVPEDLRY